MCSTINPNNYFSQRIKQKDNIKIRGSNNPICFLIQNFIAQVGQKGDSKWKKSF